MSRDIGKNSKMGNLLNSREFRDSGFPGIPDYEFLVALFHSIASSQTKAVITQNG